MEIEEAYDHQLLPKAGMKARFATAQKEKCRIRLVFWLAVGTAAFVSDKSLLLICSILAVTAELLLMTFNRRACLCIDNDRIRAGYHWLGKLNCGLDEVAFAWPQVMMMTILLKNGKRYSIAWIENSFELCSEISRRIFFRETESPEVLRNELAQIRQKRRREIYWVIAGFVILFTDIGLTVLLTGGKEMFEFSERDWVFFYTMALMMVGILIAVTVVARRCGHRLLELDHIRHRLYGAVVSAQPLPANRVRAVYTDEHYDGRLVVCGLPNEDSVYYCVQDFDENFRLVTVETSRFFNDLEELKRELPAELLDITPWFLSDGKR